MFQSTPPHGGDPRPTTTAAYLMSFNPRPHTGATPFKQQIIWNKRVSIHAPTRGRRDDGARFDAADKVSIHAPTRGRPFVGGWFRGAQVFQSTPPHGGDLRNSATARPHECFNPRPHTGATMRKHPKVSAYVFQSTPPHGGDIMQMDKTGNRIRFNPRPHTGATRSFASLLLQFSTFQSTPPHGGDLPKPSEP